MDSRKLYSTDAAFAFSPTEVSLFLAELAEEYRRARTLHNHTFQTGHEAHSVILEELEEVWEEIKHPTDYLHLRKELVQTAAMCMAAALELV